MDYVQNAFQFDTAASPTHTVTMTLAVTTGNSITVAISSQFTPASVTDNKGNSYTRDVSQATAGAVASVWRSSNVVGGSSFVLTITFVRPSTCDAVAHEISAILTPFASRVNAGIVSSGDPDNPSTLTPGFVSAPAITALAYAVLSMNMAESHAHTIGGSAWSHVFTNYQVNESADIATSLFTNSTSIAAQWSCNVLGSVFATVLMVYFEDVSANFTGTPTSGASPLAVNFTDASTGSPTAWEWAFGDGGVSTTQHPSHTYTLAGTFDVTLTVRRPPWMSNTLTRSAYIVVDASPTPGGPPTPSGIPTSRGPDAFSPFGPLRDLPGSMPFIMSRQPPPLITASTPPTAAPNVQLISVAPGATQARTERATRQMAAIQDALVRQGYLPRSGQDSFQPKTGGFDFGRAPTSDDDSRIGAQAGTWWVDNSDPDLPAVYLCLSATVDAAIWVEVGTEVTRISDGGLSGTIP